MSHRAAWETVAATKRSTAASTVHHRSDGMDARSAIFGSTVYGRGNGPYPSSADAGRSRGTGGGSSGVGFGSNSNSTSRNDSAKYAAHSAAMMEAANDEQIMDLEARVQDLKEISIQLREETQESNSMLGGMNIDFSRVGSMLGDTLKKLQVISSGSSGRHIWMMVFFVLGLFFIMYLLYRR